MLIFRYLHIEIGLFSDSEPFIYTAVDHVHMNTYSDMLTRRLGLDNELLSHCSLVKLHLSSSRRLNQAKANVLSLFLKFGLFTLIFFVALLLFDRERRLRAACVYLDKVFS